MIRKMLEDTTRADAEWIWWTDIDTLMPNMTVLPRFEAYKGFDLVVWGVREKIMEGDMNGGAPGPLSPIPGVAWDVKEILWRAT